MSPENQSPTPLVLTNRQVMWTTSSDGRSYLLTQRDDVLFAQAFDLNSATLSGAPMVVAKDVGAFAGTTTGLWSVARNGTLVYRAGGTQPTRLTWIDGKGAEARRVGEAGNYSYPSVSPDGNRVAFTLADSRDNTDIWIRNLGTGANVRLTFDERPDEAPVWSPDGTRIVYSAMGEGARDLYERKADGSGEERPVLRSDRDKIPTSWSRDGRFLLFQSTDPKTREDLWILPLDGRPPFLFSGTEGREQQGQFSPDQRWIAYSLATPSSIEIFVRPFKPRASTDRPETDSGPMWMVSTGGGTTPRWSGNGKRLLNLTAGGDLASVTVESGPTFSSGPPQSLFAAPARTLWTLRPSGDRFLFARPAPTSGPPPPFTLVVN